MPALKRKSLTTGSSTSVMQHENMVEDNDRCNAYVNRLAFDTEDNNFEELDSGRSMRHTLLDSDEISVIGYTDENHSISPFDHPLNTATNAAVEKTISSSRDLCEVNNFDKLSLDTDHHILTEETLVDNSDLTVSTSWSPVVEAGHFVGGCGVLRDEEPIHMTLEDVQQSIYDWDVPTSEINGNQVPNNNTIGINHKYLQNNKIGEESVEGVEKSDAAVENGGLSKSDASCPNKLPHQHRHQHRHNSAERSPNFKSIKHTLCHWLRLGKCTNSEVDSTSSSDFAIELPLVMSARRRLDNNFMGETKDMNESSSIVKRALPPLPDEKYDSEEDTTTCVDGEKKDVQRSSPTLPEEERVLPVFTESICKVKDCGWYWGPINGEMAEKILSTEPDGSFIVRDSSDVRYIFSLTFKLNGFVRHVRIEHDHGNFSFGYFTKFKSHTIVEFIENAVQHSRSGRYLFFLHRRPVLGPMRVQLLYPVSRFKRVQSLQHMCRFVILKTVRKDLITFLPLPIKLKNYLDTQQYYTENMQDMAPTHATVNGNQFGSIEAVD